MEICDWCRSEQKSSPCSSTSSKASARNVGSITITSKPSEHSGDSSPSKSHGGSDHVRKNIIMSGVPSPRTAARRYKLLKDVKCWITVTCVCGGGWRLSYIYIAINTHIYLSSLSSLSACYSEEPMKWNFWMLCIVYSTVSIGRTSQKFY